jgi:hypothetical protein
MYPSKLVPVPKAAFAFCRYTVALILWAAFLFRIRELAALSFVVLLLSALLRVRRAPLIFLYSQTLNKIKKSPDEMVDEYGMMFAHSLGAFFNGLSLLFLYFGSARMGWVILFFLALLKTAAAFGFCSALKFYGCMSKSECCSLGQKISSLTQKKGPSC